MFESCHPDCREAAIEQEMGERREEIYAKGIQEMSFE